jgi:hypothetical protein
LRQGSARVLLSLLDLRGGGSCRTLEGVTLLRSRRGLVSYGPPWAHYLGGYQDRLLGGPLVLTQNVHSAPITQQAEKLSFARAERK